jgi:branched-chain amino acid transport system substrate-binding protein
MKGGETDTRIREKFDLIMVMRVSKLRTCFQKKGEDIMDPKNGKKGMDRRTFIKTTAAGAAGITLASWGVPTFLRASTEPIKIGCITPLTGPMTGYGLPTKAALEYCSEKLNAEGGIMGRKVAPVFRDEQLSAEVSVRAAKDLVYNEGCKIIGGCISSGDAIAVSMAVKDMNGKAFYTVYCAASSVVTEEKFHPYTSRASINSTGWSRCVAIASAKKWGKTVKKIYCINPDYAYGHAVHNEFLDYWKKHAPQAKVIGEAWPPLGSTDFTSYITAILGAKPDLVQTCLYGGDATVFMKQASAYGLLQKVKVADQDLGLMPFLNNLRKGNPAAPIGLLTATPYPFYLFNDPENVEFYTEVHKRSGWYPDMMGYSPHFYLKLLKYAMEKAGTTDDLKKLVEVFDEGFTVDTMIGKIQLRGCDHQTLVPYWVGTLGWDAKGRFPMPILVKDIMKMDDCDALYHSCDEIKELRKKAKG